MGFVKTIANFRFAAVVIIIILSCVSRYQAQVTISETVITDANGFEGPEAYATIFGPGTSGRFDFSKMDNGFNPTPCQTDWTCFPVRLTIDPSFAVPTGCVTDYCGNIFVDSQGKQRKIFDTACNELWSPANGNASTDFSFCIVPGTTVDYIVCKSASDPNPNVAVSFHTCCTPSAVTCPADATLACTDTASVSPDFSGAADGGVFSGIGGSITMTSIDPCAPCDPSTGCIDIDYVDSGVQDFCATSTVTRTYTIELSPAVNFVRLGTTTDANGNPVPDVGPAPPQTCTTDLTTIVDNVLPMITCPADATFSLDATCSYDLSMNGDPIVTDNCGTFTLSSTDDLTGLSACSGTGTIIKTHVATDDCGNTASCAQTITIEDSTAPMITCGMDVTIALDASCVYDLSTIMPATATDNCAGVTVMFADDLSGLTACSGTGTIIRTWTATDACSNAATCMQIIIIEDQTPPTLSCPAAITLAIDASCAVDLSSIADPAIVDNCPGVTVASSDDTSGLTGCSGTGLIVRTWTVTDACGLTASCTQDITIEDQTAPTFTCPTDVILAIDAACVVDLNSIVDPVVVDNCPAPTITSADDISGLTACSGTGTIVRTWTASDACANTSTCTQNIIIEDQTDPTFVCPSDVTLALDAACNIDLSSIADPTVMDNCPAATIVSVDDMTGLTSCSGTGTIVRTWTATDACTNISTCLQNITIEDQDAPTFICPADVTITVDTACAYDLSSIADPAVMDNCAGTTIASADDLAGLTACSGTGTIVRTWTATDPCMNVASCTQNIIIEDQTPPAFVCPSEVTLALDASCNLDLSSIVNPVVTDNCPSPTVTATDDLAGLTACSGTGTIIRTWTATDACLNTSDCTQNIIIEDQTAPTFTCPADVTLALDAACAVDLSSLADPAVMDNCPGATMSTSDDIVGLVGCNGTGTIVRTWTATDACLNTTACSQNIIIEDQTAPTFTCPADVILPLDAACSNDLSSITDPVLTDNCPGSVISIVDDVTGLTGCNSTGTIVRTWTATDACGNTSDCIQNIVLEDQTAPTITCPAEATISMDAACTYNADPLITDEAIGTDNCAVPAFTYADDVSGLTACSGTGTIIRTWTATDVCGLTSTCNQNIIVEDIDPPTITCPSDLSLTAGDPTNDAQIAAWLLTVTATDNCSVLSLTDDYDVANFMNICGTSESQTVTFTATDDCGNSIMCMATIIIGDMTPPIINCPTDLVLECADPANPTLITDWLATVTASDPGGGGTNVMDDYFDPGMFTDECGLTGVEEVIFTATDDCMLMSMCTATITIEDSTPPSITCPIGTMITMDGSCAYDAQPVTIGEATATDACAVNALVPTYVDDLSGLTECSGTGQIMRTWSVEDECGNVSGCTQIIIIIEDQMAPVVNCPPEINVSLDATCGYDSSPAITGTATGSDNCGMINITYADDLAGLGSCSGTGLIERTWTATDDCLNSVTCIQNITVWDRTPPTFVCPLAVTLNMDTDCIYDLSIIVPPATSDNCPGEVLTYSENLTGLTACSSTGLIVRTWTVTDACNNAYSCTQDITIQDITVPIITCPMATTVAMDATCSYDLTMTGDAMTTDNCPSPIITMVDDLSGLTACNGTGMVTRTFTATDACGNTATCDQIITIADQTVPTIVCPSDIVIALDGTCSMSLAGIVAPVALDNCPGSVVSYTDDNSALTGCNGTGVITRTWTVTDACTNNFSCEQVITIVDQTIPSFTCPMDVTMALDATCIYDLSTIANPVTLDNCPGTVLSTSDDLSGLTGCNNTGLIIRTWTATDACDNRFSCNQNITIVDQTIPSFTCPADLTLQLDASCSYDLTTIASPVVMDNCSGATISFADDLAGLTACSGTGTIIRTWTATDACNNAFACSHNIVIEETLVPVVTCPADVTIALDNNCSYDSSTTATGDATLTDNCPGASLSYLDDLMGIMSCSGTGLIIRTFTGEDACGNISICTQNITIEDQTVPTVTCPADVTLALGDSCGYTMSQAGAASTYDNCPNSMLTFSDDLSGLTGCSFTGTIIRTYVVEDACGNSSSCVQNIVGEDQTNPTFTCPESITLNLDADCLYDLSGITDPVVSDNCTGSTIDSVDDLSGLSSCSGTGEIVRTWTATDACSNTSSCLQSIFIEDVILPVIVCPADITIYMDATCSYDLSMLPGATATDNCTSTTISYADELAGLTLCSGTGTVIRTWTATDDCLNSASCTQNIAIEDNTPPVIVAAPDVTVACTSDVQALFDAWIMANGNSTVTDNCGAVTWSTLPADPVITSYIAGATCVTFLATDACGNTHTTEGKFFVSCLNTAKDISSTTPPAPAASGVMGNFDVTYSFIVKNTGNTTLSSISLTDDMAAQMGGALIGIISPPAVVYTSALTSGTANGAYNPSGDSELLSGAWVLESCDSVIVDMTVEIDPDNATAIYGASGLIENQAIVSGTDEAGNTVTDASDDGNNPSGDNGSGGENDPTQLSLAAIGIGKQVVGTPVPAASGATGNYDITYSFIVKNTGVGTLYNLSVVDDLAAQMGGAYVGVVTPPTLTYTNATLAGTLNSAYAPSGDNEMLGSGWELARCDSIIFTTVVEIDPDNATAIYDANGNLSNTAVAGGETANGETVTDDSENGADPIGDSDGDGSSDTPTPLAISDIGVAKAITSVAPSASGVMGNFDVTYSYVVKNTGNTILSTITLVDDMVVQMGGAYIGVVNPPTLAYTSASTVGTENIAYSPSGDNALLGGGWVLGSCDSIIVEVTVEIDPDNATAIYGVSGLIENQAHVTGTDEAGNTVTDASDDGNNPSGDNGSGGENDPTQLSLAAIGIGKQVVGTPVPAASGTTGNYDVTYSFIVKNTGVDTLYNLSVVDDLAAQMGGAYVGVVTSPTLTYTNATVAGTLNSAYAPSGDNEMLGSGWELARCDSIIFTTVVEIDPDNATAIYDANGNLGNTAVAGGETADGETVTDDSENGADPIGDNDGDGSSDTPTPLAISDIGVAKGIAGTTPAASGVNGNFDVTYSFLVKNTGNTILSSIALTDDLAAQMGGAFVRVSTAPTLTFSDATSTGIVNGAFSPADDNNLLSGNWVLNSSETIALEFTVEIDPNSVTAIYGPVNTLENQGTVSGTDASGNIVLDKSDEGSDPAGDNGDGEADDPTTLVLPHLTVKKEILDAVPSGNNHYVNVSYLINVENTGNDILTNVNVTDALMSQFGGAFVSVTALPSIEATTALDAGSSNAAYTPDTDTNLLSGAWTLGVGEMISIKLVVEVDFLSPTGIFNDDGELENQATGSATDGSGNTILELSDSEQEDSPTSVSVSLSKLGGKVWIDCNGNGVQDLDENGLSGIRVEAYNDIGDLVSITFTDEYGRYIFSSLIYGNYFVKVIAPDYDFSIANMGGSGLNDSDVDNSNGFGTTSTVSLDPGECNLEDFDAGLYNCIQIGEHVWHDANMNDVRDASENGINGLKVELYRWNGVDYDLHDTQYTGHKPGTPSDDGYYKFCAPPGKYYLKFVNPPTTLVSVVPRIGGNTLFDSDIDGSFGSNTSSEINISCGDERCDIGAGFYKMGSLGDYIWHDVDFDGVMDTNEPGVPGVGIIAINTEGQLIAKTTSDANGNYMLDYLHKDKYYIEFSFPQGYVPTYANMGNNENMDSDLDESNGPMTTAYYNVMPGEHTASIDVGVVLEVLPVTWKSFTGECRASHNYLEWITASERNSSHYEVERSINATENFETIGKVLAAGTTQEEQTYDFEDFDILEEGIYYYRIKQLDLDGRFDYTDVIAITVDKSEGYNSVDLQVYPNPVAEVLTMKLDLEQEVNQLEIRLLDNLGRRVQQYGIYDFDLGIGTKFYDLDLSGLSAGNYNIKAVVDNHTIVQKIIKVD